MSEVDRKKIERESFVPTFVLSTRIRMPRLILHNKWVTRLGLSLFALNPKKKNKSNCTIMSPLSLSYAIIHLTLMVKMITRFYLPELESGMNKFLLVLVYISLTTCQ